MTKKSFLIVLSLLILIELTVITLFGISGFNTKITVKNPEFYKDLASKLKSSGLDEESAKYYSKYLELANLPEETQSNIMYNIAKSYMGKGLYEQALTYFYSAELIHPKTSLKTEIGENVMSCLEKLGKFSAAEFALSSRSQKKDDSGGKIVAKIGSDEITLLELNEAFERLPDWIKKDKFKGKEGKVDFLKQYVAENLIYRKGQKLGADKDVEIRKKIADIEKQVVIEKVIKDEIQDKIKITEDDVKLYYQANKDKYKSEKDKKKQLAFDEAKEKVRYDIYMEKLQKMYGELVSQTLSVSDVKFFPEVVE